MGLFHWTSKREKEIQKQKEQIERQRDEICSLKKEFLSLEQEIEAKEEKITDLQSESDSLQRSIEFKVLELTNMNSLCSSVDFSYEENQNITEEKMDNLYSEYNMLSYRIILMKRWLDKYQNDLDEAKSDLDSYLKKHRDEIRIDLMHELYQRTTQCETTMLRHLSNDINTASLEEMRKQLRTQKHLMDYGILPSRVSVADFSIYKFCDEFIQLNITNLIREMKQTEWENIKSKIACVIGDVSFVLANTCGLSINED